MNSQLNSIDPGSRTPQARGFVRAAFPPCLMTRFRQEPLPGAGLAAAAAERLGRVRTWRLSWFMMLPWDDYSGPVSP